MSKKECTKKANLLDFGEVQGGTGSPELGVICCVRECGKYHKALRKQKLQYQ